MQETTRYSRFSDCSGQFEDAIEKLAFLNSFDDPAKGLLL